MSGKGLHNNGLRKNQQDWQSGLEEARSTLRKSRGQANYSDEESGGMVRTRRTSAPRHESDAEGVVAEVKVHPTRYRRSGSSDEKHESSLEEESNASSDGEVLIEMVDSGVREMDDAERVGSATEDVAERRSVNNKRFREPEVELSPEELARQRRNKELTAKFNKACTITVCTMGVAAVGAMAVSIVRGLWGKDNSSLMKM